MATVEELLRVGVDRLRASGSESPRLDAELLLARAIGVDRTAVIAHPEAPGRIGRRGSLRGRPRPPRARRAGRLHPRLQGVPRPRLLGRRPGTHPATRDGAARRGRRGGRGRPPDRGTATQRDAAAAGGRRRDRLRDGGGRPRGGPSPSADARRGPDRGDRHRPGRAAARPRERGRSRGGRPDRVRRGRPPAARRPSPRRRRGEPAVRRLRPGRPAAGRGLVRAAGGARRRSGWARP